MHFQQQKILPATGNIRDFERLMNSDVNYVILLETHLAQLHTLIRLAKEHRKKVLVHVDLIQGLRSDEYAVDYLSQVVKPFGVISTRMPVVSRAKKKALLAIQRVFLLDTHALKTSLQLVEKGQPDYIEVLPGVVPNLITELAQYTDIPILAGGFIRTPQEVKQALQAGAVATTTSHQELWPKKVK